MTLTPHQKQMVIEANCVVRRIMCEGGSLQSVTREEAALLLDCIALVEEHETTDEGKELEDLIDRHMRTEDDHA